MLAINRKIHQIHLTLSIFSGLSTLWTQQAAVLFVSHKMAGGLQCLYVNYTLMLNPLASIMEIHHLRFIQCPPPTPKTHTSIIKAALPKRLVCMHLCVCTKAEAFKDVNSY